MTFKKERTHGYRMPGILWNLIVWIAVGILSFTLEILYVVLLESQQISIPVLLSNLVLYILVFGALGAIWGSFLIFFEKRIKKSPILYRKSIHFGFAVMTAVLLTLGGWLNYFYMPELMSIDAVAFNLAFVSGVILVFFFIFKIFSKFRIPLKKGIKTLTICAAVLFMMVIFFKVFKTQHPKIVSSQKRMIVESQKFNVVMILVDSLKPDHLSCYGYSRTTSPTIDKIASEGAVFMNAFSQSSYTFESVPSLLTSLYPSTLNIKQFYSALPKGGYSIFKTAKSLGYVTAIFSEMPLLSPLYGWNRKEGIDISSIAPARRRVTILFYILDKLGILDTLLRLVPFQRETKNLENDTTGTVNNFCKFIENTGSRPFFTYIHLMDPHSPYSPGKEIENTFQEPMASEKIEVNDLNRGFYPFETGDIVNDEQLKNLIDRYDEEILFSDTEKIAKILDCLSAESLLAKTVIVILADHGEEFYEHKQWTHTNTPFCTLLKVPLIMRVPGIETKGKHIAEKVELVDIFPTILDLWKAPMPGYIEGKSLLPLLRGEEWPPKSIFSELRLKGKAAFSLIQNNHHLISVKYGMKRELLLFDLDKDPNEQKNIIQGNRELAEDLYETMKTIQRTAALKSKYSEKIKLNKKLEEQLKSLGYIK